MKLDRIGAWVWGTGTAIMAVSALGVVIIGGMYLGADGKAGLDTPWKLGGLYTALKDCGSLVAGIIGFSGLAWSHFYKEANDVEKESLATGKGRQQKSRS